MMMSEGGSSLTGGVQGWLHASWSSEGTGSVGAGGFWCTALHVGCGHAEDTSMGGISQGDGERAHQIPRAGAPPPKPQTWMQQGTLQNRGFAVGLQVLPRVSFGDGCACPRVSHTFAVCLWLCLSLSHPACSPTSFQPPSAQGFLPGGANLTLQCHPRHI